MNQQFECTKIKDGLYLGNIVAAHDYEFLLCNKFGFVVNCAAEIPNVFQHENIRYLKFKLVDKKPHKLWDETLKKLTKLQKFLQEAEDSSLCCLVHSFHGQNRSVVFVIGYLMKRYRWGLKKTLEYLKSKQIFIGLTSHYISQLEVLEQILSKNGVLSSGWTGPYMNQEEEIISKTFLNSLQGKVEVGKQCGQIKKKSERRVVWLDRLEKKKKKQEVSQKKAEQLAKLKQKSSTHIETVRCHIPEYDMCDPQLIKNIEYNNRRMNSSESVRGKDSIPHKKTQQQGVTFQQVKEELPLGEKNVYQLTINNFISPSFNIINKTEPVAKKIKKREDQKISKKEDKKEQRGDKITLNDKEKKHRPTSANKKSVQKINRAQSEKQVASLKGVKDSNQETAESRQTRGDKQVKQVREKKSTFKQRDIKKELKKEIEKVEKEKGSHSSLHSLHPLSGLAQQLIKTQQGGVKRSSTPTRKERKKQVAK